MGSTGKSAQPTTISTSNGDYDITRMGDGWTVQLSGDEQYFKSYDDAVSAIWADVYWVNAPLTDKYGLYTQDDLQKMLDFIRGNQYARAEFVKTLANDADGRAIKDVISSGSAERFDRYDSDVAEQFIDYYRSFK